MASSADRNLLFGVLALQLDFITRDQLITGMQAWIASKNRPLAVHLIAARALRPEHRALLEPLVEAHIREHGNDPERSLAAVSSLGSLPARLAELKDPQLEASLGHVTRDSTADPLATLSLPPGFPPGAARFRIIRPHAEGGLGRVFVACDTELGREVALKEIKPERSDDPTSRARFTLEAEITGGLEHPGIVPVYGLGAYPDGRPFYAMRFIRGKSLKEAIEKYHRSATNAYSPPQQNLALRRLLQRLIDVCQAMHYAHSRGVLHRDLKPGNIMLGKYGETLIVDWGLAKALGKAGGQPSTSEQDLATSLSSLPDPPLIPSSDPGSAPTLMGAALGTPAFMSPEQADGRLDLLGPASDVFSLGATLYEVLTGQPPYRGDELLRKARDADFVAPRSLNRSIAPPLNAICLKAMAAAPQNRYPSARDLAHDLERYLADEPIAAYVEPPTAALRRWFRKHEKTAAVVAAALLAGLVSAIGISAVIAFKNNELLAANLSLTFAHQAERLARNQSEVRRKEVEQFRNRLAFANNHLQALSDPKHQPIYGLVLIDEDDEPAIAASRSDLAPSDPPEPAFVSALQKDEVLQAIVNLYEAWGKPDQAAKWRNLLKDERQTQPSSTLSPTLRDALDIDDEIPKSKNP